jgi:hypothetical protein
MCAVIRVSVAVKPLNIVRSLSLVLLVGCAGPMPAAAPEPVAPPFAPEPPARAEAVPTPAKDTPIVAPVPPASASAAETSAKKTTRGWADARVQAFRFQGSGACPLQGGKFQLVGSYAIENATASGSGAKKVHIDTATCEALEDDHGPLTGIWLRVETTEPIAIPLPGGAAELRTRAGVLTSVGLLAPIEPNSTTPWMKTFSGADLVLEFDAKTTTDVLFVFKDQKMSEDDRLVVFQRDIPLGKNAPAFSLVTPKQWSMRDPRFVKDGPRCQSDIRLSGARGDGSVQLGGTLEFAAGRALVWCSGARHRWKGLNKKPSDALSLVASSSVQPLELEVTKDGYRYRRGRGYLVLENGQIVGFPGTGQDPAAPRVLSAEWHSELPAGAGGTYAAEKDRKFLVVRATIPRGAGRYTDKDVVIRADSGASFKTVGVCIETEKFCMLGSMESKPADSPQTGPDQGVPYVFSLPTAFESRYLDLVFRGKRAAVTPE